MKRSIWGILIILIAIFTLMGCKPTEKNYKSAYDAARLKREKAAKEQMRPATGLLSDDGPQMRVVNGDTIFVLQERLRALDGSRLPHQWMLGVGMFKMDTNAKASADRLRSEGYPDATAVKGYDSKYYTVAATAASLDSIIIVSKKFKKDYPEYPYIGLPGAPVMIVP